MKRKFTCAHCGKKNSFDPGHVRKRVDLQENENDPTDLVAYLPQCPFCGQTTSIAPVMPHYSRTTSRRSHSGKRKGKVLSVSPIPGAAGTTFWHSKTLKELAKEQGVKPIENPNDLKGDFWPEDESADDFLAWLREIRREGKEKR